jgi:threonine/homoserine/homoserine lactone efflux protein
VLVLALTAFLGSFLDPNSGPQQSGNFRVSPTFFIVLFGIGFAVGIAGHLAKSRFVVALGILLIFGATVLIPIALQASH